MAIHSDIKTGTTDHAPPPAATVQPGTPTGRAASIDMPIDLAQRMVHHTRRLRWLLIAITGLLCVLLVSGRINFPEAAFAFTFLTLTAFLSGSSPSTPPVAARRAMAAKLKPKRSASLERMVQAWPQPVLLVDNTMAIRSINPLASEVLDVRRTGDPLSFRLRDPDVLQAVQRALSDGVQDTCTIVEKVPAERMLRLHIQPLADAALASPASRAGDKLSGGQNVLIVIEDETSTYRYERMRSDFVANASHELRTPLASISGCIETLQGPARNDPAGRERFLALMTKQSARMTRLIDDLLSLNRIEMQAHKRPTDCVDLSATVHEAIDLVRPSADDVGLELHFEPIASPATVRGDGEALRQVAINLLENAVKYGASGARVDISLGDALEGGVRMVEMRVRDYGPGIAQSHLPRLTERFYRAHEDINPLATGTGLGLAIVKHIVARHRGRLLIDSTVGEGATFSIRVPFMTAPSSKAAKAEKIQKNQ